MEPYDFVPLGENDNGNDTAVIVTLMDRVIVNYSLATRAPRLMTSSYPEYHVAMFIVKWIFPCVIFIGTVGNMLAMAVMVTKRMRYTSVNVYLAYLALADTLVLYLSGFKTWIRALTDWELLQVSAVGCKLVMFLILVSLHVSAWLVVAVSLDRFVAIWLPFTSMALCTPTRARALCVLITAVLALYNSYALWLIDLRPSRGGRVQCRGGPDSIFMSLVQPWLKLATYSCLPFVCVLFLNGAIVLKVLSGFRLQGRGSSSRESRASSRHVKERRLTAMLIWVSLSWLVLTSPLMVWTFAAGPARDPHTAARNALAKTMCFLLLYTNHGLNFYLYCVSGKRFRQALRELLRCKKASSQQPATSRPTETSMKTFRTTFRRAPTDNCSHGPVAI